MSKLFDELKRRNVVRVGIAYVVVGWIVLQLIDVIADPLQLPEWTATLVVVLLGIGLPVALIFAWAFELTPQGLKTTEEVDRDASITPSTGRKLDFLIIAGLVVAVGFLLWDRASGPPAGGPESSIDAPGTISIAVLPFTDMSAAQDQEYFGDGIAEEILNTLVRVEALSVSSRTSSFAFKGSPLSLPEIAGQLGVIYMIEGSVRSAGDQIRVTAQLIEVATDRHLWSETYDRKLDDIFAIQDDISNAIGRALQIQLIGSADAPPKRPTDNTEAYRLYLQGHYLMLQRGTQNLDAAAERLREAVYLDPGFALAWADLGASLALFPAYTPGADANAYYERGERAASRAIALAPDLAQGWAVKALVASNRHRGLEALSAIERAVELDPRNETGWLWWGFILDIRGYHREAREKLQRAIELAPTTGINYGWLSYVNESMGEIDAARVNAQQALDLGWNLANLTMVLVHYREGDLEKSKETFGRFLAGYSVADQPYDLLVESFFDPNNAELRKRAEDVLERAFEMEHYFPALLGSIWLGRGDQLARFYETLSNNAAAEMGFIWSPEYRLVRQHPEFKAYLRRIGIVDLWRIRGWPDLCRPLGADDFVCE